MNLRSALTRDMWHGIDIEYDIRRREYLFEFNGCTSTLHVTDAEARPYLFSRTIDLLIAFGETGFKIGGEGENP